MSDVKWIKITTDIFDDEKILLIESLPEAESIIVIWFKLLCLAGKMNNSGVFMMANSIAYTDKMLATIFRRKEATVKLALETFQQFGMIELIDGVITIPNWGKYQNFDKIDKNREYMRAYMQNYREKQKEISCKTNSKTNSKANSKTNSKANVNPLDKNRLDKKEIREEKNINTRAQDDIEVYGDYDNVKLTPSEYKRLVDEFTEDTIAKAIKYLDEYIEDKGYTTKSKTHNLSIRRWVIDAVKEKEQKKPKQTKADELNDAYQMLADWSENG